MTHLTDAQRKALYALAYQALRQEQQEPVTAPPDNLTMHQALRQLTLLGLATRLTERPPSYRISREGYDAALGLFSDRLPFPEKIMAGLEDR